MAAPRGLYTPVYESLPRHPKTIQVADELRISRPEVVGRLVMVWTWALAGLGDENKAVSASAIETAAEWPDRKRGKFTAALEAAGFLDQDTDGLYILHEWARYGGKVAASQSNDRSRHKGKRQAYQDGTIAAVRERDGDLCRYCGREVDWTDRKGGGGGCYDHLLPHPEGDFSLENLVVACRGCNTRKRDRTPEEAGMRLLPAPDGDPRPPNAPLSASPSAHLDRRDETRSDQKTDPEETHTARAREGPRLLTRTLSEDQVPVLDALHDQVHRLVYGGSDAPPPGWCEDLVERGATLTDVSHAVQAAVSRRKQSREYVRKVLIDRVQEREAGRDPDARSSVGGGGLGGGGNHAGARGRPGVRGGDSRDAGPRDGPELDFRGIPLPDLSWITATRGSAGADSGGTPASEGGSPAA